MVLETANATEEPDILREESYKDLTQPDEELANVPDLPDVSGPSSSRSSSILTSHRRRKRIARRITSLPLVSRSIRAVRWILGPSTAVPDSDMIQPDPSFSIHLALPRRSWHLPLDDRLRAFSKRFCPTWLLYPFLALWCMAFILLIRQQYYVGNIGVISCDAAVWADWPPDTCGIDGFACLDQLEEGTYRCLGGCQGVPLGNPRWVGGVSVDGIPLVIGGNDSIYRADSWVCPSAIHAGLVSPTLGGVITVKPLPFIWGHSDFTSSKAHGIQSVGFEPKYPGAYRLVSAPLNGNLDLHPIISTVNALCLAIVTLFLRPSPPILFSILVVLGWFQLTLISDPASFPPDWGWVAGGIPLVLLTAYWAYRVAFQRTLTAFRDLPLDTTIWQGAGYWIGLESSTIFAKLPISRLGYGGLSADGVIALVLILIVVLIVVLIQAWQMRRYGLLQYYLIRYLPLAPILLILAFIPGYTLRIHHYLYCLAAIPVLSLPNRVSLFGQAFILGLFLDGVGRWGWASILQQTTSLIGDANTGTYVPFPLNTSTITDISWEPITQNLTEMGYTGVAVMVDDILRAIVNSSSSYSLDPLKLAPGIDHFVRLAYMANGTSLDYLDPIQLLPNGTLSLL